MRAGLFRPDAITNPGGNPNPDDNNNPDAITNPGGNPNPDEYGTPPQTGDNFSLALWISLAALSVVGIVVLIGKRRTA